MTNKKIFVFYEQGFGDTLQFCRYIPLLVSQYNAKTVYFMCQSYMVDLMKYTFKNISQINVIPGNPSFPAADYAIPIMSFPYACKTTIETIPCEFPYLSVNQTKIKLFNKKLSNKFRIGLVWAGRKKYTGDIPKLTKMVEDLYSRRNMKLSQFGPLFDTFPEVEWVSLQKDEESDGYKITNIINDIETFSDTAALVSNLDLIIGVDTAVIHLSGALNKPTIVLNHWDGCWRWTHGDKTPWYSSIKIFRQTVPGNWDEVIINVIKYIQENINMTN